MTRSSLSFARYVAGETDVVFGTVKTDLHTQPRGIVFAHGSGEVAADTPLRHGRLFAKIAKRASVHAGDLGFQTWGNDLVVTRIGQAITYLQSIGVTTPVGLVGVSMGGLSVLNYALRFPENVACVAGVIPATDLADLRANTDPAMTAVYGEIDAIYGAPPNADYTGHSPILFAADLPATMPIYFWSSSDDPLVRPPTIDAFLAARPQTGHTDLGALGHTDAAVDAASTEVNAWLTMNL